MNTIMNKSLYRADYKNILILLYKLKLADTETLRNIIFYNRGYKCIYPKLKKLQNLGLIEIIDMPMASSLLNNFYTLSSKKDNISIISQIIGKEVDIRPIKSTYFLFNHTKMIGKVLSKITNDLSKKFLDQKYNFISNFISESEILETLEKIKIDNKSVYNKKHKYHPKPDGILLFKSKSLIFEIELSKSLFQWKEKCYFYKQFLNYYNENNSSPFINSKISDLIFVVGLYSYKKENYIKIMKEVGIDKLIKVLWVDLEGV